MPSTPMPIAMSTTMTTASMLNVTAPVDLSQQLVAIRIDILSRVYWLSEMVFCCVF